MSSAVPPSPYTTTARNQSMPAVPTQAQAQRTPPLSQVPVIVPMYGTPTTTTTTSTTQALQQTPSSVRRVPPPAYRSHSYQDPSELDAAGGEYHARAPDPSDVEKGESPYAAQVAAETGKPVGAPHARVQRAAPTSTGPQPPTPTRPLHQHSLSSYSTTGRTQQPSPPASTTGSNNNNNNNMYNNYPPHSSSPQQIHQGSSPSPPFKYDSHHPGQQIHRVNSRQLLGEGKTRTPDRTLPFKEEADNDEHDHDHRAQHRLSGNWDYAPDPHPQQVYLPPQVQPPHPPYGGLAVSVPDDTNTAVDDTDTDSDSDLPPQHQHQTHVHHPRNLAELKNMSHHLQEPSEGGVGGTSSSGTPRSPTNGLPHQQQQQQFAPIGMGFAGHHQQQQPPLPHHQQMVDLRTLPAHVQQMIAHQQQHGGDGTGTGSMMSSTSSAYPMAHVQYDITTNQFDPEVFRETTVAQLAGNGGGEYGNGNGKPPKGVGGQAQHYPVYANHETIASQLALQAQAQAQSPHPNSSTNNPRRPDAPEPATPQQPFSPPPRGTPYPYMYGMGLMGGYGMNMGVPGLDHSMAFLQHSRGMHPPSDSAFSPATTPFPGGAYFPFLPPHVRAAASGNMTARSSPSHFPLEIAGGMGRARGGVNGKAKGKGKKRQWHSIVVPARGESTAPPETEYSGDEFTEAQTEVHEDEETDYYADAKGGGDGNEQEEWVDEESDEEGDMLELEFHPRYVASTERRKRKFEKKWDTLVKAFNDLDRTTDATMVLMAAPPHPHTRQLLSLSSRGIRRLAHPVLHPQSASSAHTHVNTMRASFARLASYHRNTRSVSLPPLVERIEEVQGEEELRGALQAALGSLDAMRTMYMQREERWREETRRLAEDGMSVQRMMAQTLGERGYAYRHGNDNDNDNSA